MYTTLASLTGTLLPLLPLLLLHLHRASHFIRRPARVGHHEPRISHRDAVHLPNHHIVNGLGLLRQSAREARSIIVHLQSIAHSTEHLTRYQRIVHIGDGVDAEDVGDHVDERRGSAGVDNNAGDVRTQQCFDRERSREQQLTEERRDGIHPRLGERSEMYAMKADGSRRRIEAEDGSRSSGE